MTARVQVIVGGFPTVSEPGRMQVRLDSDPTVECSVAVDVWHDDASEFVQAHAQRSMPEDPSVVEAGDGNRCVAFFSVQSGPVRIVHWDAVRYADEAAFVAAWEDRVIEG